MATKTKYYTSEHVSKQYQKLTKDEKINVLYEAIDIMQQYNGRSRFLCIAMAMGYRNWEGENDTYTKE
jgi:glutaredoxin-related protein